VYLDLPEGGRIPVLLRDNNADKSSPPGAAQFAKN
jgi:hypothetical protein